MLRKFINKNSNLENKGNSKKYFYINLVIILIMFLVSTFFISKLPVQIPILHEGSKQIYIDSKIGVFIIPVLALITNMLFSLQKRLYIFHSIIYLLVLIGMSYYYYTLI